MNTKEQFSKISKMYDSQRRNLIPCFGEFYNTAVNALKSLPENARIIDLGCGTGILAAKVLERLPFAEIECSDISDKMLEVAKKRFGENKNLSFKVADFTKPDLPHNAYNAVVSALAIHHIENPQKQALYNNIYASLKEGAIFVNAEQILGKDQFEIKRNAQAREDLILKYMTPEEAAVARTRLKCDRCATILENINMLQNAGFKNCKCVFEYLDFAVICAEK